jgi:hypothetical protein
VEPVITMGTPIKGRWGQWYRHDTVTLNGEVIGRIQVRRRYYGKRIGHRIETATHCGGAAVMGRNLEWLKGMAS